MFTPEYTITNKILNHIAKIEAAEEMIRNAPILPLWEKEFRDDAVVRSVYHGTHIEGNQLQMDEAKNILLGRDVMGRPRDIQEIINYRKVIEFIDDEVKKKLERFTEPVIKKFHRIIVNKILTGDDIGEYRTKQVIIKNSQTGEVTFRPPAAVEVPFQMREFVYWLNREDKERMHPIIKAGLAHHELVYIHPFIDGNGRVARAVSMLILILGGYDIRRFFSLEEYYDKDSTMYYTHLQKASSGDLTSWLEYFTYGVAFEFERIKEKILKLSKDVKMKEKIGGKQIYLTGRQIRLMEYIQDVGYIQNQAFSSVFEDVSEDTVLRDIKDLIEKKIIKKIGSTKASRYVLV